MWCSEYRQGSAYLARCRNVADSLKGQHVWPGCPPSCAARCPGPLGCVPASVLCVLPGFSEAGILLRSCQPSQELVHWHGFWSPSTWPRNAPFSAERARGGPFNAVAPTLTTYQNRNTDVRRTPRGPELIGLEGALGILMHSQGSKHRLNQL